MNDLFHWYSSSLLIHIDESARIVVKASICALISCHSTSHHSSTPVRFKQCTKLLIYPYHSSCMSAPNNAMSYYQASLAESSSKVSDSVFHHVVQVTFSCNLLRN